MRKVSGWESQGRFMKSKTGAFQRTPKTDTDRARGWRERYEKLIPGKENYLSKESELE